MWTPSEQQAIREEIKLGLERLWRTGEIFLEKPDLPSELRNVVHYLRNVFPEAQPLLDRRLADAWSDAGLDPALLREARQLPRLSFGNWVGGDRDGHPLVTAEITRWTLAELRLNALLLLHRQLGALAARLSLSDRLQATPSALQAHMEETAAALGDRGRRARERNLNEPCRQMVNLMLARLPIEVARVDTGQMRDDPGCYRSARELEADLEILQRALDEVGAERIADAEVLPLRRAAQTFGFHLAAVDVRQNSGFHDLAVSQLLASSGAGGVDFPDWSEDRRLDLLQRELASPRPFARAGVSAGAEADATLSCHRVLAEHLEAHGAAGLGALIVSMTRSLSDLLAVYLLARETGLAFATPEGLVCSLPVVPLFETIEDLQRSPEILDAFLAHPITQRSLKQRQQRLHHAGWRDEDPVQANAAWHHHRNRNPSGW